MNVNLDATARALQLVKPSRLLPMTNITGEDVKKFVDEKASAIQSLINPPKKAAVRAKRRAGAKHPKTVAV
jgi:hypothetical protein